MLTLGSGNSQKQTFTQSSHIPRVAKPGGDELLSRIVIGNETWVPTLPSNPCNKAIQHHQKKRSLSKQCLFDLFKQLILPFFET